MKKSITFLMASVMIVSMSCMAMAEENSEGVMTYEEYTAAQINDEVVIEAYVQAKQNWWENEGVGYATLYLQDGDGAYFVYNAVVEEADYEQLVEGQKVCVTGYKSEWCGEIEIVDAAVEIVDGNWIAEPLDITEKLADENLIDFQNRKVAFKGMTVEASEDAEGNEAAFLYNWVGSGERGSDLYFNVSVDGNIYNFSVESYLCGADTDVYKAVEALNVGDVIDLEGFLYWYDGANPHIIAVAAAE